MKMFETWRRSAKTHSISEFFYLGVKYFRANLFDEKKGGSSMTFLSKSEALEYINWWKEGKK